MLTTFILDLNVFSTPLVDPFREFLKNKSYIFQNYFKHNTFNKTWNTNKRTIETFGNHYKRTIETIETLVISKHWYIYIENEMTWLKKPKIIPQT